MRRSDVTEAGLRLAELLAAVRRGETVLLVHDDRPIARLEPLPADAAVAVRPPSRPLPPALDGLVRAGLLRAAVRGVPSEVLQGQPPVAPIEDEHRAPPVDDALLRALLAERHDGR